MTPHELACLLEGAGLSARALKAPNAVVPPATLNEAAKLLREMSDLLSRIVLADEAAVVELRNMGIKPRPSALALANEARALISMPRVQ